VKSYSNIKQPAVSRAMHIQSIPMCMSAKLQQFRTHINVKMCIGEGTGNNYAYLVTDDKTKESVIIDPANPPECDPQLASSSNRAF